MKRKIKGDRLNAVEAAEMLGVNVQYLRIQLRNKSPAYADLQAVVNPPKEGSLSRRYEYIIYKYKVLQHIYGKDVPEYILKRYYPEEKA